MMPDVEINIEGAEWFGDKVLLVNREKHGGRFILTDMNFWENQFMCSIQVFGVLLGHDSSISEVKYLPAKDILFFASTTEHTENAYDDGEIGDSYLGIISNFKSWLASPGLVTVMSEQMLNLTEQDPAFKQQKIEGIAIDWFRRNIVTLYLVADNDSDRSELWRFQVSVAQDEKFDSGGTLNLPKYLYHFTTKQNLDLIMKSGYLKGNAGSIYDEEDGPTISTTSDSEYYKKPHDVASEVVIVLDANAIRADYKVFKEVDYSYEEQKQKELIKEGYTKEEAERLASENQYVIMADKLPIKYVVRTDDIKFASGGKLEFCRELKHTEAFKSFKKDLAMATQDETPFDVRDDGIDSFISIGNVVEPNMVYIARIDAHDEGKGYGTKFLDKLKIFAMQNGFNGLFAYPENPKSQNFFVKNGFTVGDKNNVDEKGFVFYRFVKALERGGRILYHGSKHKFEEFDDSKRLTGEGSDLFGNGYYLTDSEKVAEFYGHQTAKKDFVKDYKPTGIFGTAQPVYENEAEADKKAAELKVINRFWVDGEILDAETFIIDKEFQDYIAKLAQEHYCYGAEGTKGLLSFFMGIKTQFTTTGEN